VPTSALRHSPAGALFGRDPDGVLRALYQELCRFTHGHPGHTNAETLSSRNNLAYAYRAAGRLDQAIPLYERTLADREQVLGADHPDTLGSRNNLERARIEDHSD
jgi:Tetratricopeptide repeat